MPIVPHPTEDKSQMLVGVGGHFVWKYEGVISQILAGSCQRAKAETCSYPETMLQVFRVTVLSSFGTVFTLAVTGAWRQEFHTLDNQRGQRKEKPL